MPGWRREGKAPINGEFSEEVVDLTEKKMKKGREKTPETVMAPYAPANRKGEKPKAENGAAKKKIKKDKKGKKGGTLKGALIMFLIMTLLIGGVAALLYFDVLDAKAKMADLLGLEEAQSVEREQRLGELETRLTAKSEQNAVDTKALEERAKELDNREKSLQTLKTELENKIAENDAIKAELETKKADMEDILKTLDGMSVDAAAKVLSEITDRNYVLSLFGKMKVSMRSAILEAMDPTEAADILRELG